MKPAFFLVLMCSVWGLCSCDSYKPLTWEDVGASIARNDHRMEHVWCEAYRQKASHYSSVCTPSYVKNLSIEPGSEGEQLLLELLERKLDAPPSYERLKLANRLFRFFQPVHKLRASPQDMELYIRAAAQAYSACKTPECTGQLIRLRNKMLRHALTPAQRIRLHHMISPELPKSIRATSGSPLLTQRRAIARWYIHTEEMSAPGGPPDPKTQGMSRGLRVYAKLLDDYMHPLGSPMGWAYRKLDLNLTNPIWTDGQQEIMVVMDKAHAPQYALVFDEGATQGGVSVCVNAWSCGKEMVKLLMGAHADLADPRVQTIRPGQKSAPQRVDAGAVEPAQMALATAWVANHRAIDELLRERIELELVAQAARPEMVPSLREQAIANIPDEFYTIMYWPHRKILEVQPVDKVGYVAPPPKRLPRNSALAPVPVAIPVSSSTSRRNIYLSTPSSGRTWSTRSTRSPTSSRRSFRSGSSGRSRSSFSGGYRSGKN